MSILGSILNMLGGGLIGQVTKGITTYQQQALNAKNNSERVAAEERIAGLQARRDILVAESRSNWNVAFRAFLAVPFGLFINKVIVWDKILGLGTTDNLSPDLWNLMMIVYGFYFAYETAALFKRSK